MSTLTLRTSWALASYTPGRPRSGACCVWSPTCKPRCSPVMLLNVLNVVTAVEFIHRETGRSQGWSFGVLRGSVHLRNHHHPLVHVTFPSPHEVPGHSRQPWPPRRQRSAARRGAPSFGRHLLLLCPWAALVEYVGSPCGEVHGYLVQRACPWTWGCCKHRASFVCT